MIKFYKRDNLECLTVYHHSGKELIAGVPLLLERNLRTPLIEAKLVSWQIGEVINDLTGYGKYSKSSCIVSIDGVEQSWPFSMIYLPPTP